MDIKKERQVEPLKDFDESVYRLAVKDMTLEQYENEIALSEGTLSIPKEITELPMRAQYMLAFYNDRDYVNEETGKKTYQDIVESYIATLEDSSFVAQAFLEQEFNDGKGNVYIKRIPNPANKQIYMRIKQHAISFWNNNNLSQLVDIFKKLLYGGRRQEEVLKDAILDDALYHDDLKFKISSRNQAIKVMGMDKNVQTLGQDVWLKGGGKEFGKHLASYLGNDGYDLTTYIDAEFEETEESGDSDE
jgi:hypothetical protein